MIALDPSGPDVMPEAEVKDIAVKSVARIRELRREAESQIEDLGEQFRTLCGKQEEIMDQLAVNLDAWQVYFETRGWEFPTEAPAGEVSE